MNGGESFSELFGFSVDLLKTMVVIPVWLLCVLLTYIIFGLMGKCSYKYIAKMHEYFFYSDQNETLSVIPKSTKGNAGRKRKLNKT